MSASERKLLVHLAFLYLVIATANAKALTKREVQNDNYFEDLLNRLDRVKNIPILGEAFSPYISSIHDTAKRMDNWSDGSLSNLVNSIFPCQFNRAIFMCTGTLDRDSLHTIIKKMLRTLPNGNPVIPMLELATDMII